MSGDLTIGAALIIVVSKEGSATKKIADSFYSVLSSTGYGHPVHAVLVHFVIGPVMAAFILGLIAWIFKKQKLYYVARILTIFAFVSWFFTVSAGIVDWQHFYGGILSGQLGHDFKMKMTFAGVLFFLLLGTILLNRQKNIDQRVLLILYFLSAVDVTVIGFFGGSVVFG